MKIVKYRGQENYNRLCACLGHPNGIPYSYLCDPMMGVQGSLNIDPCLLEQYIQKDKGYTVGEDESIRDVVARYYGESAAKLVEEMI